MKQNDFYLTRNCTIGTVKNIDVVNRAVEIVERVTENSLVLYMDNALCRKAIGEFFNPPNSTPYVFTYEGKVLKRFCKKNNKEQAK